MVPARSAAAFHGRPTYPVGGNPGTDTRFSEAPEQRVVLAAKQFPELPELTASGRRLMPYGVDFPG